MPRRNPQRRPPFTALQQAVQQWDGSAREGPKSGRFRAPRWLTRLRLKGSFASARYCHTGDGSAQPFTPSAGRPGTGMLVMSVRMALAKLCACTCGGAIIGGGAVHVAENPPARPAIVKQAKAKARGPCPSRRATAARRPAHRAARRLRGAAQTVTTRTIIPPDVRAPSRRRPSRSASSGSSGVPIVVGGSSGGSASAAASSRAASSAAARPAAAPSS